MNYTDVTPVLGCGYKQSVVDVGFADDKSARAKYCDNAFAIRSMEMFAFHIKKHFPHYLAGESNDFAHIADFGFCIALVHQLKVVRSMNHQATKRRCDCPLVLVANLLKNRKFATDALKVFRRTLNAAKSFKLVIVVNSA